MITCGFCYVLGLSVFLVFCSKALVSLQCLEDSVNFGDIVVGSSASRELTIHNNSDCSLHYNLFIDQEVTGPYDDDQTARDVLGKLLFPYYTSEVYLLDIKHLMTGPSGNSRFCFSRISMFFETEPRETLTIRFEENNLNCFPRDQSLSDLLYSPRRRNFSLTNL